MKTKPFYFYVFFFCGKKKMSDSIDLIKGQYKVAFITNANYHINEASKNWGWDLFETNKTKKIDFKKYNVNIKL